MKKFLLGLLIITNLVNATTIEEFGKRLEQNKIKNPQSGLKGEDPIRIVGKIVKIRKYNDYNIFEILTDRNEKIDIRYRKNSLLKKDNKIDFICKNWNIMEYINCN